MDLLLGLKESAMDVGRVLSSSSDRSSGLDPSCIDDWLLRNDCEYTDFGVTGRDVRAFAM